MLDIVNFFISKNNAESNEIWIWGCDIGKLFSNKHEIILRFFGKAAKTRSLFTIWSCILKQEYT